MFPPANCGSGRAYAGPRAKSRGQPVFGFLSFLRVPDAHADPHEGDRRVIKVSPTGQVLATGRSATRLNRVFVDAHDHVWAYQGHDPRFGTNLFLTDSGTFDARGRYAFQLEIPLVTSLIGQSFHWQGLVGTPPRLSNRDTTTISGF